jgi:hypothetical protein
MSDDQDGASDRLADQPEPADPSRRQVLGRLGTYTAPAMVALLLSQPTAVTTTLNDT